jgi:homospermidine synthase
MMYISNNKEKGATWPDWIDTDFILNRSLPYMGRFISVYKDLKDTKLKDCYKFEDFLDIKKS